MEYYIYTNELYHHGIKGMKWGQRLYQNKDGSLTALGKKRRANLEGKISKLEAKNKKLGGKKDDADNNSGPAKKSVSEMTDKELQAHTNRMQLEANYYNAQKNLANATPKQLSGSNQKSRGKEMAEKFFKDNVAPAVGNAVKPALENYLKKQLGLKTTDELADLKRAFDILDYKQKIDKIKNPDKYKSIDDKNKEWDLAEKKEKKAKQQREYDEEMAKYYEYNERYTNSQSSSYSNSSYRNVGGERGYVNPNESRGLTVYNRQTTSISTASVNKGKSTVNESYNTTVNSLSKRDASAGKQRVDTIIDKDGNEVFSFDFDSYRNRRDDD